MSEDKDAKSSTPQESPELAPPPSSPEGGGDSTNDKPEENHDLVEHLPPPDGGYGWAIVFASFMCNFIITGVSNSFAILLPKYVLEFGAAMGAVSWAGSLLIGIHFCVGPVVGALTNHFGCRIMCMAGGIVAASGFALSSLAKSLPIFILTFGVIGGIGLGMIYLPSIVSVGYYFKKRRALATSIAVCGAGIGTITFSQMVRGLVLANLKWTDMHLIFAGITSIAVGCGFLMRPLVVEVKLVEEENDEILPISSATSDATQAESIEEGGHGRVASVVSYDLASTSSLASTTSKVPKDTGKRSSIFSYQGKTYSFRAIPGTLKSSTNKDTTSGKLDSEPPPAPQIVRPLARKDAFYTGSVMKLPEYQDRPELSQQVLPRLGPNEVINLPPDQVAPPDSVAPPPKKKDGKFCRSCCSCSTGNHPGKQSSFRTTLAQVLDFSILRNPVFVLVVFSNCFALLGFYIPMVYTVNAAITKGVLPSQAANLLSVMGGTATVGRIISGIIADIPAVSATILSSVCLLVTGIVVLCLPLCDDYGKFIGAAVLFGFFIGGFLSLISIVLVELLGLERLTNAFGLLSLFRGGAAMVASPIGGAILDSQGGSYDIPFWVAGGFLVSAALTGFMVVGLKRWLEKRAIRVNKPKPEVVMETQKTENK